MRIFLGLFLSSFWRFEILKSWNPKIHNPIKLELKREKVGKGVDLRIKDSGCSFGDEEVDC